jgi:hypothetical protein
MAGGRIAYNSWQGFGAVLWIRRIQIHMDPHHFGNLDPHPDPHQFADDKPKRMEYVAIWALFHGFEPFYLKARIRIRIRIRINKKSESGSASGW